VNGFLVAATIVALMLAAVVTGRYVRLP